MKKEALKEGNLTGNYSNSWEHSGTMTERNMFSIDQPLLNPELDRFGRFSFARKIARAIAVRKGSSSLAMGICGSSGEGKTTVLNFIQWDLSLYPEINVLRFNPWQYQNEYQLIKAYFAALSEALLKTEKSSAKKQLLRLIDDYAGILVSGSKNITSSEEANKGRKSSKNPDFNDLKQIRITIEKIFESQKLHTVILIDDLDKIEISQLKGVLKLIKLTANFPFSTFVLTFDDIIVSMNLSESLGKGQASTGKKLLEKMIQISLKIPVYSQYDLQNFFIGCVRHFLEENAIPLSQENFIYFVRLFKDGLSTRLTNPRMVKHYANALPFGLTGHEGEKDIVEFLLIEGIRHFFPELYEQVRRNESFFIDKTDNSAKDEHETIQFINNLVNKSLTLYNPEEKKAAKSLLRSLFPNTGEIISMESSVAEDPKAPLSATPVKMDPEDEIKEDKKFIKNAVVSSPPVYNEIVEDEPVNIGTSEDEKAGDEPAEYPRQQEGDFVKSVPVENPSSKDDFDLLFNLLENNEIEASIKKIENIIKNTSADEFIGNLRKKLPGLKDHLNKSLINAICLCGEMFTNPDTLFSFSTAVSHPGIIIRELLRNIPDKTERYSLAEDIITEGRPISFSFECFRWMRSSEEKLFQKSLFESDEEESLGRIMADRIAAFAEGEPVYIRVPEDAPFLLSVWSHLAGKDETGQYLRNTFEEDKNNVVKFLKCYLPENSEGLKQIQSGSFRWDYFYFIGDVVEHKMVFDSLYEALGEDLILHSSGSESVENNLAHKFKQMFMHTESNKASMTFENESGLNIQDSTPGMQQRITVVKKGIYKPVY